MDFSVSFSDDPMRLPHIDRLVCSRLGRNTAQPTYLAFDSPIFAFPAKVCAASTVFPVVFTETTAIPSRRSFIVVASHSSWSHVLVENLVINSLCTIP